MSYLAILRFIFPLELGKLEVSISREGDLQPGFDANLTCRSTGNANPTIAWYRRSGRLVKKSSALNLDNIQLEDAGWYYCEARKQDKFVRSVDVLVNVTCKFI